MLNWPWLKDTGIVESASPRIDHGVVELFNNPGSEPGVKTQTGDSAGSDCWPGRRCGCQRNGKEVQTAAEAKKQSQDCIRVAPVGRLAPVGALGTCLGLPLPSPLLEERELAQWAS